MAYKKVILQDFFVGPAFLLLLKTSTAINSSPIQKTKEPEIRKSIFSVKWIKNIKKQKNVNSFTNFPIKKISSKTLQTL
jgi:hypothetical protein